MFRMLLAVALAAVPSSVATQEPVELVQPDFAAIRLIACDGNTGTAFWIAPDRIITAAHVVNSGSCSIDGTPVELVRSEPNADFVEMRGLRNEHVLAVDCEQPDEREIHVAIGFPFGGPMSFSPLIATDWLDDEPDVPATEGMLVFVGLASPGMSGGPIVNSAAEVVGIVNRGGDRPQIAISRLMKDTTICQ